MNYSNCYRLYNYRLGDGWNDHGLRPKLNLVTELVPQPCSPTTSLRSTASTPTSDTVKIASTVNTDQTVKSVSSTSVEVIPSSTDELDLINQKFIGENEKTDMRQIVDDEDEEITKTEEEKSDNAVPCSKYARKITPVDSLADFLPPNSFYYNGKNSYIFPGAEIYLSDSDDDDDDDEDDIDDDSTELSSEESSSGLRKQYELNATALCTDSPQSFKSHRSLTTATSTIADACDTHDICGSLRCKSPSLPLDAEAIMILPRNELLDGHLNIDIEKNESITEDICHDAGSPRSKRTSVESVDSLVNNSDSDEHVVAQKRCKYSND